MEVVVYKTDVDICWNLLLKGMSSVTLYRNILSGVFFLDHEGLEEAINDNQAIALLKNWKTNGLLFIIIPSGFYSKIVGKGGI